MTQPKGKPTGLRRAAGTLVLVAVASLAAALLCELAVRVVVGEQAKFPRRVVGGPYGIRINEPGATYHHRSPDVDIEFRIDRNGFRADRDFAYAKPAGTKRILSLGDSFTIGYEVQVEDTFSAVLERELNARGQRVEVLNAGVSGFGTAEQLIAYERELHKYAPDIVLVTYCVNDLVDNVRSGLFRLDAGQLVAANESYVPGGGLGDFLNTNPLFNVLSERSEAFVFVKERLTLLAKASMVRRNEENLGMRATSAADAADQSLERQLFVALLERLRSGAEQAGATLVIQTVPTEFVDPPRLVEGFPSEWFEQPRPHAYFLSGTEFLRAGLGREELYYHHSHFHWTPYSHAQSAKALAALIERNRLLTDAR